MLTTQQMRDRTKFVTRRVGWWDLKPGDLVRAVEKGMGLKKGEKIKPICVIRVKSARPELLTKMFVLPEYGEVECRLEGFPHLKPMEFVAMFTASHGMKSAATEVNRIEFEYVDES